MTKSFDKIKEGFEDAIAFARGDTTRGTLHAPEEIMQRHNTDKGLTAEMAAKEISRPDLIEIIARAIFVAAGKQGLLIDDGYNPQPMAEAVLSALSAAGLAVVPREATERMKEASYAYERKLGFVEHLAPRGLNHSTVFERMIGAGDLAQDRAMVAAEDLTGERG